MAKVSRTRLGLRKPPEDIKGFPSLALHKGKVLYRAHHVAYGPWWFASDHEGRFNLDPPRGTCYLADDEKTALRERLGSDIDAKGMVSWGWANETAVSKLAVHRGGKLANTCHEDAVKFWLTREIATATGEKYTLTRRWARKFHGAGLRGVLYESRFTTVSRANAYALFDDAGSKPWPDDPFPRPGPEVCERAGLKVKVPPSKKSLTILP